MSNREALRKLSRKFPAPPEIDKIMDNLRRESDLPAAITATAILDAALEKLIIQKFKTVRPDLVGQIFLNRGPLSDFHSKILVANAFGVITSPMADEMHSIKAIRNTFAHAKVPITFDHELVAKEIRSLKTVQALIVRSTSAAEKLNLSNKTWFLLITRFLLILLDSMKEHPGTADDALNDALSDKKPPASR